MLCICSGFNLFHRLIFVGPDFSKPLWDIISHVVSNVPLPTPGKDRVLFAIDNCLLSAETPPKEWLPHADVWHPFPFPVMFLSNISSTIVVVDTPLCSHPTSNIKLTVIADIFPAIGAVSGC
jgi:hypothetical protein